MDIYDGLDVVDEYSDIVMALGNFDGVHLGHRELILRTNSIAKQVNGTPAVLTFDPHPLTVLQPDFSPPMLLRKEDKIKILSQLGIKLLVIAPFTVDISNMAPRRFVKDILVEKFRVRNVVVGYNYTFGYKGQGNAEVLSQLGHEFGFNVEIVPPVKYNSKEISSTLIRHLLLEGKVSEAACYLGYHPYLEARVVSGYKRGRELGFPTANVNIPKDLLTPANGVYAVKVCVDGVFYDGLSNIGIKPTFGDGQPKNIETYLFDFNGNLYNRLISIRFIERIRGEIKFSSGNELIARIKKDVEEAKKILALTQWE